MESWIPFEAKALMVRHNKEEETQKSSQNKHGNKDSSVWIERTACV